MAKESGESVAPGVELDRATNGKGVAGGYLIGIDHARGPDRTVTTIGVTTGNPRRPYRIEIIGFSLIPLRCEMHVGCGCECGSIGNDVGVPG